MKRLFFTFCFLLIHVPATADDPLAYASGSWYDPDRSGEGFVVQLLPDQRAVVTWFTYPPEGMEGEQAWLIGSGVQEENRIVIEEMTRPTGATFGENFDPDDVTRNPWGSLEITFANCDEASVSWDGPDDFGDGSMDLVRLTSIDDVECDPAVMLIPDRVISGRSGAWYDPTHDGEGWMLEMLPSGNMVVYWFTFDDQGRQAWMLGEAAVEGQTLWIEEMYMTGGAHFGDAFRTEDVVLEDWGEFGFLFEQCDDGKMRYSSPDERFGSGALEPLQLAALAGTDCTTPSPEAALSGGSWRLTTETSKPFSESASATADDLVYTGGGYGNATGFMSFDLQSESYQDMPDLPDERHHPMMASDGERLYLAGGYPSRNLGDIPQNNFWRFDPALGEWESLTPMPNPRAAGAAVYMHGRIWVLGGVGIGSGFQSYEIETGEWELYPGDARNTADHMQAVAFENELWWMGGRNDDMTSRNVMIWNPVSQAWRQGPMMFYPRSGFAAGVVQGQIVVTGGERIDSIPAQLILTTEVYAPGATNWVEGPPPPVAVHGATGAVVDGQLELTAGSDIAGNLSQNRATQVLTPALP